MTAKELRQKYLDFFKSKGHTIIPSASLVPENDASTLFTTAGMHPLVPYLMGEKHPGGKRVANVQKCVRTGDIDDVGDNRHLTFFEMLGNWSFGDYFKKEAIEWSWEFLTGKDWLGLDPERLYVTVFQGEGSIPRDEDSIGIWKAIYKNAGMDVDVAGEDEMITGSIRIIPLGSDDNFWIAGSSGPCGPDTEMFYDTRPEEGKLEGKFSELVASGRIMEVWNDVFMEFNKSADGVVEKLSQQNVDTGMGVERTLAMLEGKENVFQTNIFIPILNKISEISEKPYEEKSEMGKSFRIIADHLRAAVFMIADGVLPSNVDRGYILRRLIRRAIRHGKILGIENNFTSQIAQVVIENYSDFYTELENNKEKIFEELEKEETKFRMTLERGLREFSRSVDNFLITEKGDNIVTEDRDKLISEQVLPGKIIFDLYTTYGFPFELIKEIAKEKGLLVDEEGFKKLFKKHQELSRTAAQGKFKGGLADSGVETTKLHTAAHLLLQALRQILGDHVVQKGSNITAERLRFDFSHPEKMTEEEKKKVEEIVNNEIQKNLSVKCEEMNLEEAKKRGAMGVFESKYGEKVKVYTVGEGEERFSQEICGGPHVMNTGELGHFRIKKEESSSAGVRRIKAVLE
jgi:alanyl-tRNA synthetase